MELRNLECYGYLKDTDKDCHFYLLISAELERYLIENNKEHIEPEDLFKLETGFDRLDMEIRHLERLSKRGKSFKIQPYGDIHSDYLWNVVYMNETNNPYLNEYVLKHFNSDTLVLDLRAYLRIDSDILRNIKCFERDYELEESEVTMYSEAVIRDTMGEIIPVNDYEQYVMEEAKKLYKELPEKFIVEGVPFTKIISDKDTDESIYKPSCPLDIYKDSSYRFNKDGYELSASDIFYLNLYKMRKFEEWKEVKLYRVQEPYQIYSAIVNMVSIQDYHMQMLRDFVEKGVEYFIDTYNNKDYVNMNIYKIPCNIVAEFDTIEGRVECIMKCLYKHSERFLDLRNLKYPELYKKLLDLDKSFDGYNIDRDFSVEELEKYLEMGFSLNEYDKLMPPFRSSYAKNIVFECVYDKSKCNMKFIEPIFKCFYMDIFPVKESMW